MSITTQYLDARKTADRAFESLADMREAVSKVADVLHREPLKALHAIPNDWPSQSELTDVVRAAVSADEAMQRSWAQVSAEDRKHLLAPLRVSGARITE